MRLGQGASAGDQLLQPMGRNRPCIKRWHERELREKRHKVRPGAGMRLDDEDEYACPREDATTVRMNAMQTADSTDHGAATNDRCDNTICGWVASEAVTKRTRLWPRVPWRRRPADGQVALLKGVPRDQQSIQNAHYFTES